jgi:phosphonopyruvate decarboxylase
LKYKNKFGVPCSKLKPYLDGEEIPCTTETEAMAMAAGAWFAGKESEVYIQNSGLGNIIDPVTSLYKPYNIPLPKLLISNRCKPYHHSFIHKITKDILDLIGYDNYEEIKQS